MATTQLSTLQGTKNSLNNTSGSLNEQIIHRTLPREIIKWIQGLDLSYSVKDYRKDMNNGFLVAEILSRYHPGKIQMHSFDSSQNTGRKKNNWDLIDLFFVKNSIGIEKKDYDKIIYDDFTQLYDFICRLYTILTQRKLVAPPLAGAVPTVTIRSDNATNAFLLKEKGLQKLEGPIVPNRENSPEQLPSEYDKLAPKKVLRTGSRQGASGQNIGRPAELTDKGSPMRKSLLLRGNSNMAHDINSNKSFENNMNNSVVEDGPTNEKDIFDFLEQLLASNLEQTQYQLDKDQFPENALLTETFARRLNSLSPELSSLFFRQVIASRDGLVNQLFRDQHEIWKFFAFFIECLRGLDGASESFEAATQLIGQFGKACLTREPAKTKYIFNEYLLPLLGKEVKAAQSFRKRSQIIRIFYQFCAEDPISRKVMIGNIKEMTSGDAKAFLCYLSVLVEFEVPEEPRDSQTTVSRPPALVDDFLYYANQYLFSAVVQLRTMALKIYCHASRVHFAAVLRNLSGMLDKLSKTNWWQNACQVVTIIANLIERITSTKEYLSLIKHPGNLTKCYNPENERLSNQMKEEVEELARALEICSRHPNQYVGQVLVASVAPILSEHKLLLRIFVNLFLRERPDRRKQILEGSGGQFAESFIFDTPKSQKLCRSANSAEIKRCAGEILTNFVEWVEQNKCQALSLPMLQLINFCLSHVNLKSLTMDASEKVCAALSQLVLVAACNPQLAAGSLAALQRITLLHFYSEVKVRDFVELTAAAVTIVLENNLQVCRELFEQHFQFLKQQHVRTGNDSIMHFMEALNIELVKRSTAEASKTFLQKYVSRDEH